jgi:hypothetical protein
MLSWPSITARMAAADSYAGALATGQLAASAAGATGSSSTASGSSYQAAGGSAGGPPAHPSGSSGFSLFQRQQPGAAPGGQVDLETLRRLLVVREAALLRGLALAMKGASQAGGFFDAWMKHQSDLVQAAAQAYAGEVAGAFAQQQGLCTWHKDIMSSDSHGVDTQQVGLPASIVVLFPEPWMQCLLAPPCACRAGGIGGLHACPGGIRHGRPARPAAAAGAPVCGALRGGRHGLVHGPGGAAAQGEGWGGWGERGWEALAGAIHRGGLQHRQRSELHRQGLSQPSLPVIVHMCSPDPYIIPPPGALWHPIPPWLALPTTFHL